jgi:hypothetical protein
MPDYQQAKIYRILSDEPYSLIYIGSTTMPLLSQRMSQHRATYKHYQTGKGNHTSSYEIFEKYGVDLCKIELVELFPCNSKDELMKQEGHHIRNNQCTNKNIAGRTSKEWNKEFYEENKDEILGKNKEYYEANKTERYELNREQILIKHKAYQKANWDKISAKARAKYASKHPLIN